MKKARMNIPHSRFILFTMKIFGEIVTTFSFLVFIQFRGRNYVIFTKV